MAKLKILLPLAVLVILSAAVITYRVFFYECSDKLVPRLTSMNFEQAVEVLEARGIAYRVSKIDSTEANPTDPVIDQNPVGGTRLWDGIVVELIVSNRPIPLPVIDSLSIAEAVRLTNEYGFDVADTIYAYNDYIPEGLVIGYKERNRATVINKPVILVVSKGSPLATIPIVIGRHIKQAEEELLKAGFTKFKYKFVSSKTFPENYVVDIDPKEGRVKRTTTIYISLSDGIRN